MIAASAPIWSFTGLDPAYDPNTFDQIVTADATIGECASQLKAAWPKILEYGTTSEGRSFLQKSFRTCSPIRAKGVYNGTYHDDAMDIVQWAAGIWGTISMGNYPYASSYLLHGKSLLPPWPVRTSATRNTCRDLFCVSFFFFFSFFPFFAKNVNIRMRPLDLN